MVPVLEHSVKAPARGEFLRRDGFALATALASIVLVGALLTGGFYSVFRDSLARQAAEGAGILAQEALRAFAQDADPRELAKLDVGRDSLVTRVHIITGDTQSGAITVLVGHVAPSTFAIKSTGRLETRQGPVICSVDLHWRPASEQDRLRISPALQPVCNGTPAPSEIHVRTHENAS
jgi:hypothetical protein